jgi:hypothetical protein
MKKSVLRKELGIKRGGRIQISSQVIRGGKVREDIDIPKDVLQKAK